MSDKITISGTFQATVEKPINTDAATKSLEYILSSPWFTSAVSELLHIELHNQGISFKDEGGIGLSVTLGEN